MSALLLAVGKEAAAKFLALWNEAIPEMERAIPDIAAEAQIQETEAKFRVGFTVEYNLDKSKLDYGLGFSVRRKWDTSAQAPDPNQPALEFDPTVTIQTGDGPPVDVVKNAKRRRATESN